MMPATANRHELQLPSELLRANSPDFFKVLDSMLHLSSQGRAVVFLGAMDNFLRLDGQIAEDRDFGFMCRHYLMSRITNHSSIVIVSLVSRSSLDRSFTDTVSHMFGDPGYNAYDISLAQMLASLQDGRLVPSKTHTELVSYGSDCI